ncbi:MAG TPA: VOC family protein [Abditibacteriaceae bacterium]|jgi:catechol 2,3-dioxygenase-like lactoylglutathione lyase family enzyme
MIFDHINLVVRDMEAARAFYGGVLGLKETFDTMLEGDWIDAVAGLENICARCVFLEFPGGGRLELLEYRAPTNDSAPVYTPNAAGFRHIAFNVEDIDRWRQKLQNAGVSFVSPPVQVPFPVGGKTKRLCYFHDPEGNLLELAEYK